MRHPNSIELYVDRTKITDEQFNYIHNKYDVEFFSEKNVLTLWIHDDGYKPFEKELFLYLNALKGVYNNKTKKDHLDLFVLSDSIDEYGIEHNGVKYKNIKMSELQNINLNSVLLKKELLNMLYD